jgi:hypothetical protein
LIGKKEGQALRAPWKKGVDLQWVQLPPGKLGRSSR